MEAPIQAQPSRPNAAIRPHSDWARRRALVVTPVGLAAAAFLSGCGGTLPVAGDGPTARVCGIGIGRAAATAGNGPVYVDASLRPPTNPIRAGAGSAPISIRVSQDCAIGAQVSVSDPKVIGVQAEIKAKDGADEVVAVNPLKRGRSTLTAHRPGVPSITVTFVIGPHAPLS